MKISYDSCRSFRSCFAVFCLLLFLAAFCGRASFIFYFLWLANTCSGQKCRKVPLAKAVVLSFLCQGQVRNFRQPTTAYSTAPSYLGWQRAVGNREKVQYLGLATLAYGNKFKK